MSDFAPKDFVGVPDPTYVFVGIADRAKFDKIAMPFHDHGESERGHVLTKTVECPRTNVSVVFQHWIKPPPRRL